MADDNPAGATPAAEGATPSQTPPAAQPPAEPPATGDLGDAGKKALADERTARKAAEQAAKVAADELKKLKDASLSENERRDNRLAELERENASLLQAHQSNALRLAASAAARKLGFWDEDVAFGLLDRSAVKFDETGNPTNVDALLADVAKSKPRLVNGSPDFGGGPRGASVEHSTMNDLIRRAAGRQ